MANTVVLLCSEPLGRSRWRPGPGSASSAPQDARLWQHLVAPGVTSSEKREISTASEGLIILSDRALCAARLGLSYRTASVLQGSAAKGRGS